MIKRLNKLLELKTLMSFSGTIFYRELYTVIYEGKV